jgi:hypothetical protein
MQLEEKQSCLIKYGQREWRGQEEVNKYIYGILPHVYIYIYIYGHARGVERPSHPDTASLRRKVGRLKCTSIEPYLETKQTDRASTSTIARQFD